MIYTSPICFLVVLVYVCGATKGGSGCKPTRGKMKGAGFFGTKPCPGPNPPFPNCPSQPVYKEGKLKFPDLWPCPAAAKNGSLYWNAGPAPLSKACSPPGKNGICTGQKPFSKWKEGLGCCCPTENCWTDPSFNWILSACQGSSCGYYSKTPNTTKWKDLGTQTIVNYVASYQWDIESASWIMNKGSSYNTDGARPSYDLLKQWGGLSQEDAWMQPQPGGSADWGWGYYAAGVKGVGPPGMMFVLSVEKIFNTAWYMTNQVTIDRGPDGSKLYPSSMCENGKNYNCWGGANGGEIDFLEAVWTVNEGGIDDYRRLYATQWNDDGRANPGNTGSTCNADGGWYTKSGLTTNSYFLGNHVNEKEGSKPYVFVAVVDRIGTFIYRIPSENVSAIWPGLGRKEANCTLPNRPSMRPPNQGPPCRDNDPYCALFLPNCQDHEWGSVNSSQGLNSGCRLKAWTGMCSNWFTLLDNTNQWHWPEYGQHSVINVGRTLNGTAPPTVLPWNYDMEATQVDWSDNPKNTRPGECCVADGPCWHYKPR